MSFSIKFEVVATKNYIFIFILFQQFGVKVVAIDLSSNMINVGMERAQEVGISEEVTCISDLMTLHAWSQKVLSEGVQL